MIKLLCKIIENIKESNVKSLSESLQNLGKENIIIQNPIEFLYEKILSELNKNKKLETIILKYYINLLIICANKALELEKRDFLIKAFINNENIINYLLFNDNHLYISENNFLIKHYIPKNFEKFSLFNSEINKSIKKGKIICFLDKNIDNIYDDGFGQNLNNVISNETSFFYDSNNSKIKLENALIIMEDFEQLDFYNASNFEIKNTSNLQIINADNKLKNIFFKNNSNLIVNKIKKDLINKNLSEKGIYLRFKILDKILNYIDKNDLIIIFHHLWNYYEENKFKENNYPFLSLEYIQKKINECLQHNNLKNIFEEKEKKEEKKEEKNEEYEEGNEEYEEKEIIKEYDTIYKELKEKDNNENLFSLFDFTIKENIFEINRSLEYINKTYRINLINPIKNHPIEDDILQFYNESYQLTNLSFYIPNEIFICKENSILFVKLIENDLSDISNILKKNRKNIKVIIISKQEKYFGPNNIFNTKPNDNNELDQKNIINFISNNSIPVYKIEINQFEKIINFFIKGQFNNYYLYKNEQFLEDNNNIFNIFKLNLEKICKDEDEDIIPMGKKIKDMPKDKINAIINNPFYKAILCLNFSKNGICPNGDKCVNAHGDDEIKEIESIRLYLQKAKFEGKLKLYEKNRNKLLNELREESKNLFIILNIKKSKRLIYDILNKDCIKLSELENIFGNIENISYIYEVFCLEYYFNIENNISNDLLKVKLINYFKKLAYENGINNINNKWILYNFGQIEKTNFNRQLENEFVLDNLNPKNLNNQTKLVEKFSFCSNILYDKLLFLSEITSNNGNNEFVIKYYFNIMNSILNKFKNILERLNNSKNKTEKNYDGLMLLKTINILYNYYCKQKLDNNNNKEKNENFKFFNNNIDDIIKKLISTNLSDYFPKNKTEDLSMKDNTRKKLSLENAFIIEFMFKFLDFCLILLYKENQLMFFKYILYPDNHIFKYYYIYKILSLEKLDKIRESNDYIEIIAFIYYILELLKHNDEIINDLKSFNKILLLNYNNINEHQFKGKSESYDITINFKNIFNIDDKLIVYCSNNIDEKLYIQDIIDLNNLSIYDYSYKLRLYNDLCFVPVNKIITHLYSFENSKKLSDNENNNNIENIIENIDIPKYTWNIGYDGKNYIFLSEKDNTAYNSLDIDKIYLIIENKRIQTINTDNNKLINFIDGNENCSSFVRTEKGEIYIIDIDRNKYKWLDEKEKISIQFPIYIPNVKIMNISANYDSCYAIGENGNLYENKGNNFKKILPPENTMKFLQCACGDGYVICLIKNNEGKGIIYAKGNNINQQCGIDNANSKDIYIDSLTKLEIKGNNDFKYISTSKGFSAAITSCGKLYIWGEKLRNNNKLNLIKTPFLINENKENSIIIDKIFLNHGILYCIGRILEDGNYIIKLLSLETNENEQDSNIKFNLKEVNLINKEENDNSKIIPIKILIEEFKTYCLCINETKFIEEIKNKKKETGPFNKLRLSISITRNYEKDHDLEHLKNIYKYNGLNEFIELFNSFPDKYIKDLIRSFDGIKREGIEIKDIEYNELIEYLKRKEELTDLLLFFINNEKNEGKVLFNYLKYRISLIEENLMNFIHINNSLESEKIFQTLIEKNLEYLDDDMRLQYFYDFLLNMNKDDYYENPNIPVDITINRFKANNFKEKFKENNKSDFYLNESIFGQLFNQLKDLIGKDFLIEKKRNNEEEEENEADNRLFIVKLEDEKAIDQGGPYREILSDICDDIQSDYIELFIKTPNNKSDIGDFNDKYIINPSCNSIIYNEAYEFVGKLMILAISSGETFNFNFHPIIWKSLLENKITFKEYETIDYSFYDLITKLEERMLNKDEDYINSLDLNFVIKNSNEKDIELIKNGQYIKVTLENAQNFIDLAKEVRINEISNQIKYIKDGLYSGIGKNILKLLNWRQLEKIICGENIFDIEDFKIHTKCDFEEEVVQWFWEWLENCKEEDKFKYLKFVSGRSRLPKKDYTHTIILKNTLNKFPSTHTCFSTLYLSKYDSKEIFIEKMEYAIENATTISDS